VAPGAFGFVEPIGRRVGCGHFYLCRIFTQEMGQTITAFLRDLRMEKAAALLREGRLNFTEAALEVGYSSLSHFSATFRETFGCCPGLYPLATIKALGGKLEARARLADADLPISPSATRE
jgi:AraC-like DNA-binding protein